ncbi:2135_t:CDS:2 [Paraglomus brasilianum]|uniref:2135_t:CDS:1 n=1 Tax=Paraglomus brasilianum TaxID=144538 RepID=A0A9N9DMQ4_9GLOM|nr:2135_t:CDS:2 [Paraglomus brasilianum]
MQEQNNPYKVVVAAEDSPISHHAIDFAFDLCSRLSCPFTLNVVYITALNPSTNIPFLSSLDKANNLDIRLDAKQTIAELQKYLEKFRTLTPRVNYTFAQSEGYGTVGENLTHYITVEHPDTNLLVLGSRGLDGLKKIVLSSTSDYVSRHIKIPVAIIKPHEELGECPSG